MSALHDNGRSSRRALRLSTSPFEQLERALAAVRRVLRDDLRGEVEILALEPEFFRAKGAEGTVVGLRLLLDHAQLGVLERMVTVRWAALERLEEEGVRCRAVHESFAAPLRGFRLLADQGCAVSTFPFDRRLPRAVQLLRAQMVVRLLASSADHDPAWRVRKRASKVRVLSYRPERRVVLRWDLAEKHAQTGERRVRSVVVRCHARALRIPLDLLDRLAQAGVNAPRALVQADPQLYLESCLPGRPGALDQLPDSDTMSRLGTAIGRWHRLGRCNGMRASTPALLARRARASAANVGLLDRERARCLRRRVIALAKSPLPVAAEVALHGDLHPGQLLVDGSSVHLIDWDRAARGAAAEDLANLLVHLQTLTREARPEQARAFQQGYVRERPWPAPAELHWHLRAARLRLADLGIRRPGLVASVWLDDLFAVEAAEERQP